MDHNLQNRIDKQNKDFLALLNRLKLSPSYQRLCSGKGVNLEKINGIKDIQHLPLISKSYLDINSITSWSGVPNEQIVRMHATSGTTGHPTYVPYTQNDINLWSNIMAKSLILMGVKKSDVVFNALPYGMFSGGLGFHYGAEKIGCTTIPAGASCVDKHIEIIENLNPDIIMATPSYGQHLFESFVRKRNKRPTFRIGVFGGECWTEESKTIFEQSYNTKAYNCYGLTEVIGPGVAHEIPETNGKLFIWEEHFFPEIINPRTLDSVEEGEWGELVLTSLSKEAAPLMRYRTYDITRFTGEKYMGYRLIDRIQGRTDDLLIIRGVNVYPMQFEEIILTFQDISTNYLIEICRPQNLDKVTIKCELKREADYFNTNNITLLRKELQTKIKNYLGITVEISILEKGTLPVSQGKAKRASDLRRRKDLLVCGSTI